MASESGNPLDGLEFISVPTAARLLGIGRSTLWRRVWAGEVPSTKLGTSRRLPVAYIRDLVEQAQSERRA